MASFPIDDDKDLDDAALWAVIDSAAAAAASSRTIATATSAVTNNFACRKPLTLRRTNVLNSPQVLLPPSPSPASSHRKFPQTPRHYTLNSSISVPRDNRADWDEYHRPQKVARSCVSESSPEMVVVKRMPAMPVFASPENGKFSVTPFSENNSPQVDYQDKEKFTHCLSGRFPTVSLFKDCQDAALAILEKSDYTMISGSPFIKKSGWRKIAFYFNISFEIKDKTIEFDDSRNVQRAEFVVRAYMQGGRFSDGWGSCERREKKFNKPNNDIPSTAETRAKNKACQDLLGIGAYRSVAAHSHSPR